MRAILYSTVAIVVIAVGANLVLGMIGFSSAEVGSSQAVRLEKSE